MLPKLPGLNPDTHEAVKANWACRGAASSQRDMGALCGPRSYRCLRRRVSVGLEGSMALATLSIAEVLQCHDSGLNGRMGRE
jgi:hypothetical protein